MSFCYNACLITCTFEGLQFLYWRISFLLFSQKTEFLCMYYLFVVLQWYWKRKDWNYKLHSQTNLSIHHHYRGWPNFGTRNLFILFVSTESLIAKCLWHFWLSLTFFFFNLKELTERGRQRETVFLLLSYPQRTPSQPFSNLPKGQRWAMLNLGAELGSLELLLGFPGGLRGPQTRPISCCFLRCIRRQLDGQRNSWNAGRVGQPIIPQCQTQPCNFWHQNRNV